jgi:DNA-binding PadR family transcriptional regulator
MKLNTPSLLGHALLGLLLKQAASGYALRRIFTDTPMASFSDSPGAIYPALSRLEQAGMIQGKVEDGVGLRQRKIFRLTPAGRTAIRHWLIAPITREDVVAGINKVLLRFAFLDDAGLTSHTRDFLLALQRELKVYVRELRAYLKEQHSAMPTSGRLALLNGVLGYEAHLRWTAHALKFYPS